ncbi:glycosyltransferase family 4 protein [Candidatus Woesearchaeota archaeon]|jgi:glycosyltransferase involved in cell wall biosynthesis|nr:glycosyltransferase family 4 protein [Candidatus Woesearchaeota archaeon]
MKTICFVNPTLVLRRPIVELVRIYAEKGYKVSLMFPSKGNLDYKFHFNKNLNHKNIKLIPIKSIYSERFRFALPDPFDLLKKTVRVLKENNVLHIWEYYYPYSTLPLLIRNFINRKCKIILTTDGIIGYSYFPPEKWLEITLKLYLHTFGRLLFNLADKRTTYSAHIRKNFPRFLKKIFKVVPTGIHLDKIKFSQKARDNIRKEFKINKKTKLILFVGMLTERKRADIVLQTAKKFPKDVFLIVGDGYLRQKLDKQKQDMKLKNVHFLGKRNDIIDIYSACDLFYLPSLGEGLPGTVMEAMACGKPIVATKENGTIDLVTKDVGLLVKQDGDYIKAFEIAINTKFNSKKIINQIKKYDWTKSIKNYAFFSNKKK